MFVIIVKNKRAKKQKATSNLPKESLLFEIYFAGSFHKAQLRQLVRLNSTTHFKIVNKYIKNVR